MSKKTPVMSHDPLLGLEDDAAATGEETISEPSVDAGLAAGGDAEVMEAAASEASFALPDSLTIADVDELHKTLNGLLVNDGVLELDGGDVEMVDGAGLQLLAALFKEAASRQKVLRWQATSDALRRGAQDIGLSELLSLDASEAA